MKLTKKLLAMALAGVMLLTILTGCGGGKTGDRLVEEYMAAFLSENLGYKDVPITHDVPEIKTVADMFKASWLNEHGDWTISPNSSTYTTLRNVFSNYENGYTVNLYACEVDSKQRELNQTMRVMSPADHGLSIYPPSGLTNAIQCATRLVTRENKSYRIVVIIYDHHTLG